MYYFENLKAYDFERNQICDVLSIVTSKLNDRKFGEVEMNNGSVTFWKNAQNRECVILEWTGQKDSNNELIYRDDLLENDEMIFRVEWNQNQSCWWLSPFKHKNKLTTDMNDFIMVMDNQSLGNGYFSRKDLTKIGNYWTNK